MFYKKMQFFFFVQNIDTFLCLCYSSLRKFVVYTYKTIK